MTCLVPEWVTCFQDQVSNAKDVNELMNNYPLVAVRMWVLHEEAPEGTTFFQHFNLKLELIDISKLKELWEDRYKTAILLVKYTTKDNEHH